MAVDGPFDPASGRLLTLDLDRAVAVLRAGGLVAIPTETVYGLAADAEQPAAVRRIFAAKGRPADHPLIVHLAGIEHVDGWIASDHGAVRRRMELLASVCWPGPLTMLVPRGPRVLDEVTGGRETVGLRVPSLAMTLAVLEQFGGGAAAPSANRYGKVSPTTAAHVASDLAGFLDPATDAILDGGPCPVGVESTIIDLTTSPPQVLRAGAIDTTDIERILATPVTGASGPSRASGMLAAHYAPNCAVVLVDDARAASFEAARWREAGSSVQVLDRTADVVEAARELYTDLRRADAEGLDALVVVLPPAVGLGHALRDRLLKAAAGTRPARPSPTG